MEKIKIIIEKSADSFGAYSPNVPEITGMGNTAAECKQSVQDCIDTILEFFEKDQIPKILLGDYEIEYQFDTISFLDYYKGIFTNAALEKITGINQKQLQHYSTGHRKPRKEQREKIVTGIHKLANELLTMEV